MLGKENVQTFRYPLSADPPQANLKLLVILYSKHNEERKLNVFPFYLWPVKSQILVHKVWHTIKFI